MDHILLFSLKTEHIKVTIEAYFDADGNLIIDGYDIGKTVEEYWGDRDYEYSTTVTPDEVKKLYYSLQISGESPQALLLTLQSRFHTNTCYSEIQKFLDQHNIRYTSFSWT